MRINTLQQIILSVASAASTSIAEPVIGERMQWAIFILLQGAILAMATGKRDS